VLATLVLKKPPVSQSGRGSNALVGETVCRLQHIGVAPYVESEPITFTGNSYARYTLVGDTSSRKRQVDMEKAFYEDSFSISMQTTQQAGLVYWMGGPTDYAALEVSPMCCVFWW